MVLCNGIIDYDEAIETSLNKVLHVNQIYARKLHKFLLETTGITHIIFIVCDGRAYIQMHLSDHKSTSFKHLIVAQSAVVTSKYVKQTRITDIPGLIRFKIDNPGNYMLRAYSSQNYAATLIPDSADDDEYAALVARTELYELDE